jgi:hypothetical protein
MKNWILLGLMTIRPVLPQFNLPIAACVFPMKMQSIFTALLKINMLSEGATIVPI